MSNEIGRPDPSASSEKVELTQSNQGSKRPKRAKNQVALPPPDAENYRPYEPLMKHNSRTGAFLASYLDPNELEELKESFYINYLLNKPKARKAIGLKHSLNIKDEVLKPYVNHGFTGVPSHLQDPYRDKTKAKAALSGATSAWLQHLRRSNSNLKQVTVFIERETYDAVLEFRKDKIAKGQYGHGISLNGVINRLLKSGLYKSTALQRNAGTSEK